jgi:hypothetical protein
MNEETKIDKDYKEAFNLGYELAKELNLKFPMFKDLNLDNSRIKAMQLGMTEYDNEIVRGKDKKIERTLDLGESTMGEENDKDKGLDWSI